MRQRSFVVTQKSLWARAKAIELMFKHGLHGWTFAFDGAKKRAGFCCYPHGSNPGGIRLSVHYCERNDEQAITDTILHEIAHALVGPGHGHNETWRKQCVAIGAIPRRCYDSEAVDMPMGRWQAQCQSCLRSFHRHRRPRQLSGWWCKRCGKQTGSIVWRDLL